MSKAADLSEEQLAANNRLINDIKTGLRAFNDIVGSNQGTTGHSVLWWVKLCCYFARTNRKYIDSTGHVENIALLVRKKAKKAKNKGYVKLKVEFSFHHFFVKKYPRLDRGLGKA